jgi:hypothetical protein
MVRCPIGRQDGPQVLAEVLPEEERARRNKCGGHGRSGVFHIHSAEFQNAPCSSASKIIDSRSDSKIIDSRSALPRGKEIKSRSGKKKSRRGTKPSGTQLAGT